MKHDRSQGPWRSASGIPLQPFYGLDDIPPDHRASLGAAPGA